MPCHGNRLFKGGVILQKVFRISVMYIVVFVLSLGLLFPSSLVNKALADTGFKAVYDHTLNSEIPEKLRYFKENSDRVSVEVIGQSAVGKQDIYSVVISDEELGNGKYGNWDMIKEQMLHDPEKTQEWIEKHPDFKVPILINGSIHGNEYVGADTILKLIERFAFENDEVTTNILSNSILVFNVVANPDGRDDGTRFNRNGLDLNRDLHVQTQPETQALVNTLVGWNPMVFFDLHGYILPNGLIEPATGPHNPNYEYDLFIKWAYEQGLAMEQEVLKNDEVYSSDEYKNREMVTIPLRDMPEGWDDYPPNQTNIYGMHHGIYSYTLEAPDNNWDGVMFLYNAVMGGLEYAAENKNGMLHDMIEVYKRGVNHYHPGADEGMFPNAYLLPVDETDPTVTLKAVDHFLKNGIEVDQTMKAITINGETYEAGTYVINMNQAKAALANTLLWDGGDTSQKYTSMYDVAAWGLPDLWGFEAVRVDDTIKSTTPVTHVSQAGDLVGKGPYLIQNSSVQAVALVNELISKDIKVYKGIDGNFYVESQKGSVLQKTVRESGIRVATSDIPEGSELLEKVKVAVFVQDGAKLALERLGFDVTKLDPIHVADAGLNDYDAVVYSGNTSLPTTLTKAGKLEDFKQQINDFLSNGGKWISSGKDASKVTKEIGLTDVGIVDPGGHRHTNAMVYVENNKNTPLTGGYSENDIGFVYSPVWFTDIDDELIVTSYGTGDFYKAGFWKDHAQAEGQPVIVKENDKDVLLIGLRPDFRNYPDYLFRLFSNAIYFD